MGRKCKQGQYRQRPRYSKAGARSIIGATPKRRRETALFIKPRIDPELSVAGLPAHTCDSDPMRIAITRYLFILLAGMTLHASPARADVATEAIRKGGVALLIRHATAPGNFDPENFKQDDCSTQRNLSDAGRDEARRIGAHLKTLGLKPGEVLTSQWCRCRDTATLAFGAARDWPALNSFIRDRDSAPRQTADVLARIGRIKPGEKPLVLITHQVVVTAVTGIYPQSGEVVVVAPTREAGKSGLKVIGSIKPPEALR